MFRSNSTKEWYKIRQHINCSSKNVICLVTCLKCGIQAVEKATHFGKRISNYITHIGKKGIRVAHFYGTTSHSIEDFSIAGIARLEGIRTKTPRHKPPEHKPPDKNPMDKNSPCQKSPRQKPPRENF